MAVRAILCSLGGAWWKGKTGERTGREGEEGEGDRGGGKMGGRLSSGSSWISGDQSPLCSVIVALVTVGRTSGCGAAAGCVPCPGCRAVALLGGGLCISAVTVSWRPTGGPGCGAVGSWVVGAVAGWMSATTAGGAAVVWVLVFVGAGVGGCCTPPPTVGLSTCLVESLSTNMAWPKLRLFQNFGTSLVLAVGSGSECHSPYTLHSGHEE